ncbi:MAG: [FeFe] hydrogenase, group A [Nanoarchaeota archaeon]|nr:[FeFe] hydrogenase, group A [Nanoarchaeota archaeon]MBU1005943.1 [FeFe] hydrogenase, group A [Nanoarchaeota archaeon]MBU1947070.1 [FeFe] hydrogenase, group A [Nanoarchaeota archaeon]
MSKIKLTINNMEVEGKPGDMIIDVARRNGIEIPHFCWNDRMERIGACRLCIVEVKGMQKLIASCCTPIKEGIVVNTHSPRVLEARRTNMELLLANHDLNCVTCKENLSCKLQKYAEELMIQDIRFDGEKRTENPDDSSVSIRRDNNKCILCEQCVRVCNDIQTVYAIGLQKRGFHTKVSPPFGLDMNKSACVNCGQCVVACPTGALTEKSDIQGVINALNSDKYLIAQTAPSIRATLGECFGMPVGTPVTGKMVTALKEAGFHQVFDTDLAADICIIEEATEFIKRFKEKKDLPMITTCCPAWIKFGEQFFFDELHHMSSCRSPQAILASLIKTYYAEKIKKNPKDIILVDIMPCTAKKFEILRPEFSGEADYVLTTVELAKLLKQLNVDFSSLKDSKFDNPLGESTGAAAIFGHTGGVMEAALRTAADWISGKDLKKIDYKAIRSMDTMKEAEIEIGGEKVKVCVVHTLGEARKLMEQIKEGKSPYHFIEIMACYGGCIGGGGQPPPHNKKTLAKRTKALIDVDEKMDVRKSHKNPSAIKIYKEYLGEFGSKRAHKLLHTHYSKKDYI